MSPDEIKAAKKQAREQRRPFTDHHRNKQIKAGVWKPQRGGARRREAPRTPNNTPTASPVDDAHGHNGVARAAPDQAVQNDGNGDGHNPNHSHMIPRMNWHRPEEQPESNVDDHLDHPLPATRSRPGSSSG